MKFKMARVGHGKVKHIVDMDRSAVLCGAHKQTRPGRVRTFSQRIEPATFVQERVCRKCERLYWSALSDMLFEDTLKGARQ